MTRPQHRLFNIPRGYYFFQLSTVRHSQIPCSPHGQLSNFTKQDGVKIPKHSSVPFCFCFSPKGFAYACFGNACLCVEQIRLIDCSREGLESTPQTKKRMANYTSFRRIK